jgi:hypothetical protein
MATEQNEDSLADVPDDQLEYIKLCSAYKAKYAKNGIFAYLNINSLRYKFEEIKPIFDKLNPIWLCLAETKIDESFHSGQFMIKGYHPPMRQDHTSHGGGLIVYVRSDIPCQRLSYPDGPVEHLPVEITLNKTKWCVLFTYKPLKVPDANFNSHMDALCEKMTSLHDNILIMGDLNFDLSLPEKSRPLQEIMDLFSLSNLIKDPTYTHANGRSLLDVAVTTNKHSFCDGHAMDIPCSDGHSMILATTKVFVGRPPPRTITYRPFKKFIEQV